MKKIIVAMILAVFVGLTLADCSNGGGAGRYLILVNGLYGYIDGDGNVAIEPDLVDARSFSEGLAPAELDGEWGYVDASGRWAIEPQFNEAWPFSEGLGRVLAWGDEGLRTGFVDKDGDLAIPAEFDLASDFSEGFASFSLGDQTWGYINTSGDVAIEVRAELVGDFHDGRAQVSVGHKWGYIDSSGEMVVQPRYSSAYRFSDGLAAVDEGYIDTSGNPVIQQNFRWAGNFAEGLAPAMDDSKHGYIDTSGRWAIEPVFEAALEFSEGLAAFRMTEEGPWGYIDASGTVVIEPQFYRAEQFTGGLALVWLNRNWDDTYEMDDELYGYVDKTGRIIWPPIASAGPEGLSEELAGTEGLVGKWFCAEVAETYEFTSDGQALYTSGEDGITHAWTYTVKDGRLVVTDGSFDYVDETFYVHGDTLTVDDSFAGHPLVYERVE